MGRGKPVQLAFNFDEITFDKFSYNKVVESFLNDGLIQQLRNAKEINKAFEKNEGELWCGLRHVRQRPFFPSDNDDINHFVNYLHRAFNMSGSDLKSLKAFRLRTEYNQLDGVLVNSNKKLLTISLMYSAYARTEAPKVPGVHSFQTPYQANSLTVDRCHTRGCLEFVFRLNGKVTLVSMNHHERSLDDLNSKPVITYKISHQFIAPFLLDGIRRNLKSCFFSIHSPRSIDETFSVNFKAAIDRGLRPLTKDPDEYFQYVCSSDHFFDSSPALADFFSNKPALRLYFKTGSNQTFNLNGTNLNEFDHHLLTDSISQLLENIPLVENWRARKLGDPVLQKSNNWAASKTLALFNRIIQQPGNGIMGYSFGEYSPFFQYTPMNSSKLRLGMSNIRSVLNAMGCVYMFYKVYHYLYSDKLVQVDELFSHEYILASVYSHQNVQIINGPILLITQITSHTSIQKVRRMWDDMFIPEKIIRTSSPHPRVEAERLKRIAAQPTSQSPTVPVYRTPFRGHIAQGTEISAYRQNYIRAVSNPLYIADTVNMFDGFAKFVLERRAKWTDIPWRNISNASQLHDEISKAHNAVRHKPVKRIKKLNPFYDKLKKFNVTVKDMKISCVIPSDSNQIREWGTQQRHCIGGYANNINDPTQLLVGFAKGNPKNKEWVGHMQLYRRLVNSNSDRPQYSAWRVNQFYAERNTAVPEPIRANVVDATLKIVNGTKAGVSTVRS